MSFKIFKKYPEVNAHLSDMSSPIFIKLISTILFIRQKLNYTVNKSEVFYDNVAKLDPQLFNNVEKDDLPMLLELFVRIICDYVNNTDILEDDEGVETKEKICLKLRTYAIAN
jgi:hypothetical protein